MVEIAVYAVRGFTTHRTMTNDLKYGHSSCPMSPGTTAVTQLDRLSIQTTHILLPAGFAVVATSIRLAPGIDRTLLRTADEVRDAMLSKQTRVADCCRSAPVRERTLALRPRRCAKYSTYRMFDFGIFGRTDT